MVQTATRLERLTIHGIDVEVLRKGQGNPILLLHGLHNVAPDAPFLDLLSAHGEVIAPSHPGFGHSPRPRDFDTVYDLVHLYLDLIERLPQDKVTLLGFSFGGWLAAEIATLCSHRLDRLILVDPLGIKLGDRESRDILDLFATRRKRCCAVPGMIRQVRAGLQCDVGRCDGGACAESRCTVRLWLAAIHVQPEPAPLAVAASRCRRRCCGAPATAW